MGNQVNGGRNASDILQAVSISVHFGGLIAVDQVDLHVEKGEILGLIGPNGAGKTTLINALTGFQKPTKGRISVMGSDATAWPPHRLARHGVARTFQTMHSFGELTVLENIEVGGVGVGLSRAQASREARVILSRIGLDEKRESLASALAYGESRRLAVGRSLAMRPDFLLLDEPAAGLNEVESKELRLLIESVRKDLGCGVLIVEHDVHLIMGLCDRVHVLDHGKTLSIGTPRQVRSDEAVIRAYLGPPDLGH